MQEARRTYQAFDFVRTGNLSQFTEIHTSNPVSEIRNPAAGMVEHVALFEPQVGVCRSPKGNAAEFRARARQCGSRRP
jgi:hypothetical protein